MTRFEHMPPVGTRVKLVNCLVADELAEPYGVVSNETPPGHANCHHVRVEFPDGPMLLCLKSHEIGLYLEHADQP